MVCVLYVDYSKLLHYVKAGPMYLHTYILYCTSTYADVVRKMYVLKSGLIAQQ